MYCIRLGNGTLVLGGGGYKAKNIRRYQDNPKLLYEATLLIKASGIISGYIKDKHSGTILTDIGFCPTGDLIFDNYDD